jgi:hypothetical protein
MADAVASGPDEEAPDTSTQDDAPADGTVEDHPGWVDNRKLKAIQAVKKQIEKSRTFLVEDWTTSTQTVPSATDPDGLNPTVVTGGAGPDSFRTALDEETWNSDTAVEYQSRINSAIDSITAVLDALVAVVTSAEKDQESDPGEKVPPHSDEANWGQY